MTRIALALIAVCAVIGFFAQNVARRESVAERAAMAKEAALRDAMNRTDTVVVCTKEVAAGVPISADSVEVVELAASKIPEHSVRSIKDAVGRKPKEALFYGMLVNADDLQRKP